MKKKTAKMSRPKKMSLLFSILIVVTLLIGVALWFTIEDTKKTIEVPITKGPIKQGSLITPNKVKTTSISRVGLTDNLLRREEDVIGKYAIREFGPEEYFFSTSITDKYVRRLSERLRFSGFAIPVDQLKTVNGEIRENDFISIALVIPNDNKDQTQRLESVDGILLPTPAVTLYTPPELTAVRVLGIYDGSGKSIEMYKEDVLEAERTGKEELEAAQSRSASMLTLDLLPFQKYMLVQALASGDVSISILPERVQNDYRVLWGLVDKNGDEVVDLDLSPEMNKKVVEEHSKKQDTVLKKIKETEDEKMKNNGTNNDSKETVLVIDGISEAKPKK